MRRRALLLALPTSLALAFASPALADTTVGETGTPVGNSSLLAGIENVNPAAVVPTAGTITSLQTQAAAADVCAALGTGAYNFQVLRPEANSQFLVLGDTGNQTDPCDGQLHSYPAAISVQPGDVLGVYVVNDWAGLLTGGSRDDNSISEPAVGQTITLPNTGGDTIDLAATLVTTSDSDLTLANVPANMTADATSPSGAVVNYTPPTAVDADAANSGDAPAVSCTPAPGATFAIGTTTVTCTGTDADDSNSPVTATFTVTVEGAAQQLADLATEVKGVGPGKSLVTTVDVARLFLASGHPMAACMALDSFSLEVLAQAGKTIRPVEAVALFADAQRIQAVIPCAGHPVFRPAPRRGR